MRKVKRLLILVAVAVLAVVMCRYSYRKEQVKRYAGFETAKVVYVIDGDTVVVEFSQEKGQAHVRLLGIDCEESVSRIPERNTKKGKEASEFTEKLLDGRTVYLQKDETDVDRYGRLLRYVWIETPDDPSDTQEVRTKMASGILLDFGMAREMNIPPDTLYADQLHEIGTGSASSLSQPYDFGVQ